MLVVLTLLAVAGMRMSSSSLQIVGNMQARKYVENVASQAIEDVVNSIAPVNAKTGQVTLRLPGGPFNVPSTANPLPTPAPGTGTPLPGPPSGIRVTISERICLASAPAAGYSAVQPIVPEDNLWQFTVT